MLGVLLLGPRRRLGMSGDDTQVALDRSLRRAPALLPVLERVEIEIETPGELLLRQAETDTEAAHVHRLSGNPGRIDAGLAQVARQRVEIFDGGSRHGNLAVVQHGLDGSLGTQHRQSAPRQRHGGVDGLDPGAVRTRPQDQIDG